MMRIWPVTLGWVLTRALVVLLLVGQERTVAGDVHYYAGSLSGMGGLHLGGTMVEYPVPAVVLLLIPYAVVHALGGSYEVLVAGLAVVTDLAFCSSLVHARGWRATQRSWLGITPAEWMWLLAVPALGATAYARFDLFPGIMVGLAMLYVVHRPAVAAAFGALATGVKYWPALVLPTLAAPRVGRGRVLATLAIVGGALTLLSLVLGGWHRLFTPLDYQHDRGLQIESVAGTPAMLAWSHHHAGYSVDYTDFKAYDVSGPHVGTLLHVASVASVVVLIAIVALWVVAWLRLREGGPAVEQLVWLVLASITGFVVTNKVLSPQYLLWLLPATAAGLLVLAEPAAFRRMAAWSGVLLVAAALTHEVFPRRYGALLGYWPDTARVTDLLALRNLLLLGLFLYAAGRAALLVLAPRPAAGPDTVPAPRAELVDD